MQDHPPMGHHQHHLYRSFSKEVKKVLHVAGHLSSLINQNTVKEVTLIQCFSLVVRRHELAVMDHIVSIS
jgi:hypothetical protein